MPDQTRPTPKPGPNAQSATGNNKPAAITSQPTGSGHTPRTLPRTPPLIPSPPPHVPSASVHDLRTPACSSYAAAAFLVHATCEAGTGHTWRRVPRCTLTHTLNTPCAPRPHASQPATTSPHKLRTCATALRHPAHRHPTCGNLVPSSATHPHNAHSQPSAHDNRPPQP